MKKTIYHYSIESHDTTIIEIYDVNTVDEVVDILDGFYGQGRYNCFVGTELNNRYGVWPYWSFVLLLNKDLKSMGKLTCGGDLATIVNHTQKNDYILHTS